MRDLPGIHFSLQLSETHFRMHKKKALMTEVRGLEKMSARPQRCHRHDYGPVTFRRANFFVPRGAGKV
jgi:hypothetical protein